MLHVDSALLDLTEWLCRRFQVLTGRTNVWLAFQLTNLSIVVFFVWAGMHFRIGGRPFRIALAAFCGGLLYLLTQTLFKVPWRLTKTTNIAASREDSGIPGASNIAMSLTTLDKHGKLVSRAVHAQTRRPLCLPPFSWWRDRAEDLKLGDVLPKPIPTWLAQGDSARRPSSAPRPTGAVRHCRLRERP
jgi:hypothetical protein